MIRKISIGSLSEDGVEWMSRLLAAVMTTHSQGRNPHAFLLEASWTARGKSAPPSLLPPKPTAELAVAPRA